MITGIKFTPQLDIHRWTRQRIEKDWFEIQEKVYELGSNLHSYMINYIKLHKHRFPSFGKLEKSITLDRFHTPGSVGWGLGDISKLPEYWYVLNYGKKITGERFIPGGGKFRPVKFGSSKADPNLRGHGTQLATTVAPIGGGNIPTFIRPINYIEATIHKVGAELRRIIPASAMPMQLRGTRGSGGAQGGGAWRT